MLKAARKSPELHSGWPLLVLFFLITIATAADSTLLRYQSDLISSGQGWRLLTGHLSHLGWAHWFLNSLGLLLTALLFDSIKASQWCWSLLCSSLAVSCGLLWLEPQLSWYVGLSGVLHGLLVFGAILLIQKQTFFYTLILLTVIGKLIYEQIVGSTQELERLIGGSVVINAHLYGAIGGGLAALSVIFLQRKNMSAQSYSGRHNNPKVK